MLRQRITSRIGGQPSRSFRELLSIWLAFLDAKDRSPETIRTFRWTVGEFVNFLESEAVSPSDLTVEHTARFVQATKQRPGRNGDGHITASGIFALAKDARNFLNFLHANQFLTHSVKVPVPTQPKGRREYLHSQVEREALLDAAKGGRLVQRDYALILLMLETGLRNFEVRAINWGDLSWHDKYGIGKVHVRLGKGRKERKVPFPVCVWEATQNWRGILMERLGTAATELDSPVFLDERGHRMSKHGMRMLFKRLSMRAGIWVTPHMLRHTYGRDMAKRNLPLPALQCYMGHADIKTTMIYATLEQDDGLDDLYLEAILHGT